MSLPTFPSIRQTNGVPGKPAFVSDSIIATQGLMNSILAIANVPNPGFAILSGFVDNGTTGFSSGYIILNGYVYFCPISILYGKYLIPNITDEQSKLYSDGNSYFTYKQYQVSVANSFISGSSPQLNVNSIDSYRIDLTTICANILNLENNVYQFRTDTLIPPITLPSITPVNITNNASYVKLDVTKATYNNGATLNYTIGEFTRIVLFDVTTHLTEDGMTINFQSFAGKILQTYHATFGGDLYHARLLVQQFIAGSDDVWLVTDQPDVV